MNRIAADIAVIGGGPAGLAAAIAAAEKGIKVALFEKSSTTGGTGNMGMGLLGVETRLQKLKQIALTKEEAVKIFLDYTHWRVDARLVRDYIYKSADTIDWLERMGVEFVEPAAYFPGGHFTWHIVKPSAGGIPGPTAAANMYKVMTDNAAEMGVKFYLNTTAKKIIKSGNRISGVITENTAGIEIQADAKAAIVCSGGFGDNPELIKKYTGYDWGKDLFSFRIPGLVGDGLRMAWEVGAGREEMNMEMIYGVPSAGLAQGLKAGAQAVTQPNLMVNLQGERFINEEIMFNTTYTGNALARQKDRCGFIIFDEDIKKYYEQNGYDYISVVQHVEKATNIAADFQEIIESGNPHYIIADSIEELAGKTGIHLEGLKKTIIEYNLACETGRDMLFNKKPRYLRPVRVPKYYAGKCFPGAYGSLGGIKINHNMEVITDSFNVIPGLYAAGVDACGIYGDSYVFILPGNTMGFSVNSGRIAGENAVAYLESLGS